MSKDTYSVKVRVRGLTCLEECSLADDFKVHGWFN